MAPAAGRAGFLEGEGAVFGAAAALQSEDGADLFPESIGTTWIGIAWTWVSERFPWVPSWNDLLPWVSCIS